MEIKKMNDLTYVLHFDTDIQMKALFRYLYKSSEKYCYNAETYQVKFKPIDEKDEYNGILVYNENEPKESMFICSCCGGIFPLDEVDSYKKYPTWVDFSAEI